MTSLEKLITISQVPRVQSLAPELQKEEFYSSSYEIINKPHNLATFDKAIELLSNLWLERHPSNDPDATPENYRILREAFEQVEHCGSYARAPFRVEALYKISEILVYEGDFPSSMRYVEKALQLSKDIASNHPLHSFGVRFFQTRSGNLTQLGQLVTEPEYFLKTGELGWHNYKLGMFCVPQSQCANRAALRALRKDICVITDEWLCNRLLPLSRELEAQTFFIELPNKKIEWQWSGVLATQSVWEEQNRPPLFSLNPLIKSDGRKVLESAGVPKDAWFVALHVREESKKFKNSMAPLRNAHIDSYHLAIKSITERGGWVIRMGGPSMAKLPPLENVIDYAHAPWRTDWMDLYLTSEAKFFLGTASGLCGLPMWYGTPMIFTNTSPFNSYPPSSKDLYIPKLFKDRSTGRLIPFSECVIPPLRNCYDPFHLDRLNFELIENTPEEIRETTEEMLLRDNNPHFYSVEDHARQEKFLKCVAKHEPYGLRMRIGAKFLQRYENLL